MDEHYVVKMRYNRVWKDFYFKTEKEAKEFMYRQVIKGCNGRDLILLKQTKN